MPPQELLSRLKAGRKKADIVIRYVNFPDSLKAAVEYAAGIWEMVISSKIPIYLEANWQVLSSKTLGSCGAASYYVDFDGAPQPGTYYPVALAEKLMEKELTGPGNPDMTARFNSTVAWYPGTDGKTPSNRYDLASTVLHEIAHGLGFIGFLQVRTTTMAGSYGNNDKVPAIYDQYVEDYPAHRLTDLNYYGNPSRELYNALVSNNLYSGSPTAYAWSLETRPRLYAPSTFSNGSSIYHLNDSNYPYGSINALMTSAAGMGEAIHYPGPMTAGILADLGWQHLFFRYRPVKDAEEITGPLIFPVSVESETGINREYFWLVYSYDNFQTHRDSVGFTSRDERFEASLQPTLTRGIIHYFLSVKDSIGRIFSSPPAPYKQTYSLKIGPDLTQPVIYHNPVENILSFEKSLEIQARVTDNLGVDSVKLAVRFPGLPPVEFLMEEAGSDTFRVALELGGLAWGERDSILYSIMAVDRSGNRNRAVFPATGWQTIRVERVYSPVFYYSTDFSLPNSDFISSGFSVSEEKGFDNPALHSVHPYPSPDKDNASLELYTLLRYPVILSDSGTMRFDEVVLVEPGEEGAVFGSEKFWDFVIVEGSKDYGKTWLPLTDGYDSGDKSSWNLLYNQKTSGNNSTSLGAKEHFIRREFRLTGNRSFTGGDTILIRFRLFSDPYAHGWGWVIDNLEIQDKTVPAPFAALCPGDILIYPNPAKEQLNILFNGYTSPFNAEVRISDLTGRILMHEFRNNSLPGTVIPINLNDFPGGICLVAVKSGNNPPVTRKISIHRY